MAGIDTYRASLRSITRGLWSGALSVDQFEAEMRNVINRRLSQAWEEGAAECGIKPDEFTTQEFLALGTVIQEELTHIGGFAEAIQQGSRANGGKLGPLLIRAGLWVNRYAEVRDHAKQMACGNQKLEWVLNAAESCRSCLRLSGQVRRASVWEAAGLRPKARQLACMQSSGGVPVCKCEFRVSDRPSNRGPLPKI